jgi:transposase, IS30 family
VECGRPPLPRVAQAGFWDAVRSGLAPTAAGVAVGSAKAAERWFREAGGVAGNAPRAGCGRYLSLAEREEIAVGVAAGEPVRVIAARLGRSASTVSREVRRNCSVRGYRALTAQVRAEQRARRPKTAKLAGNGELRGWVQARLEWRWSPEQISAVLKREFAGRPEMQVSHEAIYRAIYVQGAGCAAPRAGRVPAHRAGAAQASAGRQPWGQDQGHGDDQRPARGGS